MSSRRIEHERFGQMSGLLDSLLNSLSVPDELVVSELSDESNAVFPATFIPQFSDSVYASRIAELAKDSEFELVYNNHVKGLIRVYTVDKRKHVSKVLGLTGSYFPLFEEKLREYGIPSDMKYLAVVESALDPTAVSCSGARGLWQFMGSTGRMYGLHSSPFVEDRYDPVKATEAACKYLRDLHDRFGDWFLTLAAYNAGAGNVRKAIRAAGGARDYWEIWPYLPEETRAYVPAFIAVSYVMNYYGEHNIQPSKSTYHYAETEPVPVGKKLAFEQLHESIGVPMEELEFLNPQYKAGLIPESGSEPRMLQLTRQHAQLFRDKEQEIYVWRSAPVVEKLLLYAHVQELDCRSKAFCRSRERKLYVVRRGDSLSRISRRYDCSVSQLIEWNGLKSFELKPGQKLVVFRGINRS